MPGLDKKIFITAVIIFAGFSVSAFGQYTQAVRVSDKPFMIFVTPILPPPGTMMQPDAFNAECFRQIKELFDSTSFQAVHVASLAKADLMSNQKKDILITTDSLDRFTYGNGTVTMALWMRYRIGLLHSRVDVTCYRGQENDLPQSIAKGIYKAIKNEFTGVLELEGGPPGMTATLVEGVTVTVPRSMLFPPGDYYVTSRYPYFQTRTDTIEIFQGRTTKKRILLLPE
jgi:hypothetical protein